MYFVWSCHLADLRPRSVNMNNCLFLEQCRVSAQYPLKNVWIGKKLCFFLWEVKCILWLPHGSVIRLLALKMENKKNAPQSFKNVIKLSAQTFSLMLPLCINCLEKLFAECELSSLCPRKYKLRGNYCSQLGMFQPDWWYTNLQIMHSYLETTG